MCYVGDDAGAGIVSSGGQKTRIGLVGQPFYVNLSLYTPHDYRSYNTIILVLCFMNCGDGYF